jgi:hypothetical protein
MLKDWGLGSVWLKTLVIGHIKLASVNCKYVNFYRYCNLKEVLEDICLSRIAVKLENLNVDPRLLLPDRAKTAGKARLHIS